MRQIRRTPRSMPGSDKVTSGDKLSTTRLSVGEPSPKAGLQRPSVIRPEEKTYPQGAGPVVCGHLPRNPTLRWKTPRSGTPYTGLCTANHQLSTTRQAVDYRIRSLSNRGTLRSEHTGWFSTPWCGKPSWSETCQTPASTLFHVDSPAGMLDGGWRWVDGPVTLAKLRQGYSRGISEAVPERPKAILTGRLGFSGQRART